jgi:hypothetical protein
MSRIMKLALVVGLLAAPVFAWAAEAAAKCCGCCCC